MPIGIAAAGAAVTAGGAIMSAKAQKSAAKKGMAAQNQATAAELEAARMNADLYRDVYNSNLNVLSPYSQLGYGAAQARNALLGLGAGPAYQAPAPIGQGGSTGSASPMVPVPGAQDAAYSYLMSQIGPKRTAQINSFQGDTQAKLNYALSLAHDNERAAYQSYTAQHPTMQPAPAPAPAPSAPATTPAVDYNNAFDGYLNSSGYKFQLDQGLEGLAYAKRLSGIDSGDMVKSSMNYARDIGSQYFSDYMGLLGQQQGMGLGAASAIAGQGSQFGANMAGVNNAIGSANANNAYAQGNMALAMGQNQANMWGGIASGVGNALGGLYGGSRYGQPNAWGVTAPGGGIY